MSLLICIFYVIRIENVSCSVWWRHSSEFLWLRNWIASGDAQSRWYMVNSSTFHWYRTAWHDIEVFMFCSTLLGRLFCWNWVELKKLNHRIPIAHDTFLSNVHGMWTGSLGAITSAGNALLHSFDTFLKSFLEEMRSRTLAVICNELSILKKKMSSMMWPFARLWTTTNGRTIKCSVKMMLLQHRNGSTNARWRCHNAQPQNLAYTHKTPFEYISRITSRAKRGQRDCISRYKLVWFR